MGLFDHFPYTNFHELNLTWILNALKEIQTTMDQFVAINALKYADPIQWNIVRQYEKNTIVIDPLTGTAYISVQPIPSGVIITKTDYWSVVFDLGSFVVRAAKNFTDKYEDETTLTATFPSNVNDWLIWGDTLYLVISPIVAGDQYVDGSNIVHFTAEDVIGHIQDLNTTDKSNLVAAINEVLQTLTDTTGDLDDLDTTDKSNLVAAINEVLTTLANTTGDLDDLNTTDKSNLVAAINEVDNNTDTLEQFIKNKIAVNATNPPVGYSAMVADDPTTDNAPALQALINNFPYIYIPAGTYYIRSNIHVLKGYFTVIGDGAATILKVPDDINKNEMFVIIPNDAGQDLMHITFKNMLWDGNKVGRGLSMDIAGNSFITAFTTSQWNVEFITLDGIEMINAPGFVTLFGGHANGSDMTQYFTRNITIKNSCWHDNDTYVGTSGAENVTVDNCRMYHNGAENLCFDNFSLNCKLTNSYIGTSYGGVGSVGIGITQGAVIENCQFDYENSITNPAAKYRTCITVTNSFGAASDFAIKNCSFRNAPTCGVYLEFGSGTTATISGVLENLIFKNCGKSVINEVPYDKGIIKASMLLGSYELDNQGGGEVIFDALHAIWSGTTTTYTTSGADLIPTFTVGDYHRFGILSAANVPRTIQNGFYRIHAAFDLGWAGSTPPDLSDNKHFRLYAVVNGNAVANDEHVSYLNGHYQLDTIVYIGKNEQIEFIITDFDGVSPVILYGRAEIEYIGSLDPYITDLLF